MAPKARRTSRSAARAEALAAAARVEVPSAADVVVVGGGAAGLAAAITAAEAGAVAVVLERSPECGRSILATGNGRCNFCNTNLGWEHYNDPAFVEAACGPTFLGDVLDFFAGCGLTWAEEEGGRLYPLSRQAASVRSVLLARASRAGVTLAPAREAIGIERLGSDTDATRWRVLWRDDFGERHTHAIPAGSAILASGGGSELARGLGLACAPFEPVLCPLACTPADADGVTEDGGAPSLNLATLDGRRAHADVRLLRDGRELARESGEVLFRSYGLSGIAIFDLSRVVRPGDRLVLDLTCGLDAAELAHLSPDGVLDPVIAAELEPNALVRARALTFAVDGPAEPERAQVTRGGLLTSQFDPATLEARDLPGLLAAGEALDVDGACGGYNLAWAWKSGIVAGRAAAERASGC